MNNARQVINKLRQNNSTSFEQQPSLKNFLTGNSTNHKKSFVNVSSTINNSSSLNNLNNHQFHQTERKNLLTLDLGKKLFSKNIDTAPTEIFSDRSTKNTNSLLKSLTMGTAKNRQAFGSIVNSSNIHNNIMNAGNNKQEPSINNLNMKNTSSSLFRQNNKITSTSVNKTSDISK